MRLCARAESGRRFVFNRLAEQTLSLRMRHLIWRTGAVCALCIAVPALAASDHATGDGSDADNQRLLPGLYPADPVLTNGEALREPYDPFFDVDWSVALRGTYTNATAGNRFDVRLVPSVNFDHQGSRSAISITGSAEVTRPLEGQIDVTGLRLGLTSGYALDSNTALTASGNLSLTQALAGSPGLATNVAIASETLSGDVELGVTRQLGRFNVGVTGAVERNVYGPTTLVNGTVVDNSDQNLWSLDSGLRVGFQATPIFEVFGTADVGRDIFDLPSSVLLIKNDASTASVRGGVTGRWNGILEATASTGLGLRRFDEASLGEVVTQLYDANVTFTPDPTWRMRAGFTTKVEPPGPDAGGTTRIEYAATAEVGYTVNSWLALRALADWRSARFVGNANTESGYGWGAGADYKVNAHTAVTADYDYDHADSTANGPQDAHRVTLGITLSR